MPSVESIQKIQQKSIGLGWSTSFCFGRYVDTIKPHRAICEVQWTVYGVSTYTSNAVKITLKVVVLAKEGCASNLNDPPLISLEKVATPIG